MQSGHATTNHFIDTDCADIFIQCQLDNRGFSLVKCIEQHRRNH